MKILISLSKLSPEIQARKYTKQECDALPNFSVEVSEKAYKLPATQGHVVIDNAEGLGETPDGRNVLYKGFVGLIDIDKLMSLYPNMSDREPAAAQFVDLIKQGYGIASPMMHVEIDPFIDDATGPFKITGHEGRARTWALKKMGVKVVPVNFIFSGYRARHVNKVQEDFVHWIQLGVQPERSAKIVKNVFKEVLFG